MNRILKKTILLMLVLVALASAGIAVACGGDKTVPVTLIGETQEEKVVEARPGDPLPVLEFEDKDFEGYWTDASYTQRYEGTTVPEGGVKLYYKLHSQYYTLVIDYGDSGSISFECVRGQEEKLPAISPTGMDVAGFSTAKGGTASYLPGNTVKNLAEKDQTITLYACAEIKDIGDYVIENGTVTKYTGSSTSLVLPLGATRIAAGAFAENAESKNIVSLTVPGTYTEIECGAFEGLDSLTSLTSPFIGQSRTKNRFLAYMFGAKKYTDNTYSFAAYSDGSNITFGDVHLESLVIPKTLRTVRVTESVKDIAEGAFYCAYSLENLILDYPSDLQKIGKSAFENCFRFGYDSTLGVAVCPEWLSSVSTIGDKAFKSYTGNTESDIKSVPSNGVAYELVTYDYPLNSLMRIPELTNVETIGDEAFYYCALLEGISFGNKLVSVGESSFVFAALSFGVLRFPDSLEKIGDFAFQGAGVTAIEFGTGIRDIGIMSFVECSELEMVSFRGEKVPVLAGGQCFSNTLDESITDSWNIILNDEFGIYVPAAAEDSFRTAPDWVEYAAYVNPAQDVHAPAFWSSDGSGLDAKFEFSGGNVVFVTDPGQQFISSVDNAFSSMTYGQTCGTYYAMMYEVLDAEEYAAVAGTSVPLYENQYVLHLWHPDLLGKDGKMLQTLYLVVTELPYAAEGGRALIPVAQLPVNADLILGDAAQTGSVVITYNKLGIPSITSADGTALEEPAGTYYSRLTKNEGNAVSYTVTYYNENFDVLGSRTFVQDETSASDESAPLYEQKDSFTVVRTDASCNGGVSLFLKGDGTAAISYTFGGVQYNYTASVTENSSVQYGEEGYTVGLTDFKQSGSAVSGLKGDVVFRDFDGQQYSRIDLTVGEFSYMIVNVQDASAWTIGYYDELSSISVKMPQYSTGLMDNWRYKKLSETVKNASIEIFNNGSVAYYRELDAQGLPVSWGRVEFGADGVFALVTETTVSYAGDGTPSYTDSEARRDAKITDARGSFELEGREFTFYEPTEDLTLIYAEEVIPDLPRYYYTVKTDGYGNIYILDEQTNTRATMYLGKYTSKAVPDLGGGFRQLTFTGTIVDSYGRPSASAEEEVLWIIYDSSELLVRSEDASEAHWYASLVGIFAESEDTKIVVNDAFGYKLYELTVNAYGGVSYVQYEYTLDRDGNATYTVLPQGDVYIFMPVFGEDETVSYCVAIDESGRVMFSVRRAAEDAETFVVVQDGGQSVTNGMPVSVTVNTEQTQILPEGGVTFGTLN